MEKKLSTFSVMEISTGFLKTFSFFFFFSSLNSKSNEQYNSFKKVRNASKHKHVHGHTCWGGGKKKKKKRTKMN